MNNTGSGIQRHEQTWVAQLVGRKVWLLAPPKAGKPPTDMEPCQLYYHGLDDWTKGPLDRVQACEVGAGETIYLPSNWYQGTCNLDPVTIGVGGRVRIFQPDCGGRFCSRLYRADHGIQGGFATAANTEVLVKG